MRQHLGCARIGGEVVVFQRVGGQIEELVGVGGAVDEFPCPHAQGDHGGDAAFGGIFHRHGFGARRAHGQRQQADAIGPGHDLGHRDAG